MSDEQRYRRNPLLRVRPGPPIECDLLLDGRTFELPSPALVGVLAALPGVGTRDQFTAMAADVLADSGDAGAVVDAFIRADLLVDEAQRWPEMAAVEHWIERGWLDALLFHLRARAVRFDDDGVADPGRLHDQLLRDAVDEGLQFWKSRPGGPAIALPKPTDVDELPPLGEVLLRRRSNRPWTRGRMTLDELATVLHHASAETRRLRLNAEESKAPGALLNSAFSALELSVAAFAIDGLEPGLYHYDPARHDLTAVRRGDLRAEFVEMCAGQARAGGGAATIVISAAWRQYFLRYRHAHAYRVLMVNAGELGQKILLLATALGLSTFLTPAFREPVVDRVLRFDPSVESAVEAIGLG